MVITALIGIDRAKSTLNKESVKKACLQMSAKWLFKFPMLVKVPMSGFLGKSDAGVTFEILEKFRQWDFYKTDDVVRFDKMLSKSDDVVVFEMLTFEIQFHNGQRCPY